MNHVYRVVWSSSLGMFQVASELTRSHGGKSGGAVRKRTRRALALNTLAAAAALAAATPTAFAVPAPLTVDDVQATIGSGSVYSWDGTILNLSGAIGGNNGVYNYAAVIGSLSNRGLLNAVDTGIVNASTIGSLINSGSISGGQNGIVNNASGAIETLVNEGTIGGAVDGIYNSGYVGAFSNSGTIDGLNNVGYIGLRVATLGGNPVFSTAATGLANHGTLGTLTNGGLIVGTIAGIENEGAAGAPATIGLLQNNSRISSIDNGPNGVIGGSGYALTGLRNAGTLGSLRNSGVISSVYNNSGYTIGAATIGTALDNSGTIAALSNSGAIVGTLAGVANSGTIGVLSNSGSISSLHNATTGVIGTLDGQGTIGSLVNDGQIDLLVNQGTLGGTAAVGLANGGTIDQLVNNGYLVGSQYAISIASGGAIGTLTNGNAIIGDIVNLSSHDLLINGAAFGYGLLAGASGVGTISSPNANVVFASGTQLLADIVEVGSHAMVIAGGTVETGLLGPQTISGNFIQTAGNLVLAPYGAMTYGPLVVSGNTTITGGQIALQSGQGLSSGESFTLVDTAGSAFYGSGVAYSAGIYSTTITHTIVGGHDDLIITLGDPLAFHVDGTVTTDGASSAGPANNWVWSGADLTIFSGSHAIDNSTGAVLDNIVNGGTITALANGIYTSNSSGDTIGSSTIGTIGYLRNEDGAHIASLTNDGVIGGSVSYAVLNTGTIGTLTNSGTVSGLITAVVNSGTLDTLTNTGTIVGRASAALVNYGATSNGGAVATLDTLANSGLIAGPIAGLYNGGAINTIVNSGTISGAWFASGTEQAYAGILNIGSIGAISNSGTISGYYAGIETTNLFGLAAGAVSLGVLDNQRLISGEVYGVFNGAALGTLTNSGTIAGGNVGVLNAGTIGTFANSGTISGGSAVLPASTQNGALVNLSTGTLATMTNSGVIAGNIVNLSVSDLTINGGTDGSFGTLTGVGNASGVIRNTASNLDFGSGNLVLNDNIAVGAFSVKNQGAVLQVNRPVTISGNYSQGSNAALLVGVAGGASANGLAADTGYGRLVVTGDTFLEAGSSVRLTSSGYAFAAGQRFVVVDTAGTANYNAAGLKYAIAGNTNLSVTGTVIGLAPA